MARLLQYRGREGILPHPYEQSSVDAYRRTVRAEMDIVAEALFERIMNQIQAKFNELADEAVRRQSQKRNDELVKQLTGCIELLVRRSVEG